jgi:prepilin-type N-terminal cleavage/methylation domain-containing protein
MKNNQGFTLIETMVALVILGLVALMASQGLSGAFRVKNKVEQQITDQESFSLMMKYIQHDCEAMVKNTDQKLPPTFLQGNKFVWIMRHYSSRQANGWQFVGYIVEENSLKRFVSDIYPSIPQATRILESLSKDPDLGLQPVQLTYQLAGVTRQNIQAFWSSYSNKSPIGLNVSLSMVGSATPLTNSCIADGKL